MATLGILISYVLFYVGSICIVKVDASFLVSKTMKSQFGVHSSFSTSCSTSLLLMARPPPRSSFDLEAIEAFETQLDQEEDDLERELNSLESDDNGDDDDHLDDDHHQEEVVVLTVPPHLAGKRIDTALTALLQEQLGREEKGSETSSSLSRSFCGNLVSEGCVHLLQSGSGDKQLMDRKSFKVEAGQELEVSLSSIAASQAPTEIIAQDLPIDILYEDEHMIVLNKAAHMVVHPAAGNWDGTVVNALAYYLTTKSPFGSGEFVGKENDSSSSSSSSAQPGASLSGDSLSLQFRPGIVHRLDKGTTGVLVVAKTQSALARLSADFAARRVKKTYLAMTVGNPGKRVVIDKPIGRHPVQRKKMRVLPDHDDNALYKANRRRRDASTGAGPAAAVSKPGRRALSMVDTIAFDGKLSLVQVAIQTGRTHQIRVHLQDRHTPVYGDDVYGLVDWNRKLAAKHKIDRPLLHAYRLELDHPVTGEKMFFQAPLADDMLTIAKAIYPRGADSKEDFPEVYAQSAARKKPPPRTQDK